MGIVSCVLVVISHYHVAAQTGADPIDPCIHEKLPNVKPPMELPDGETIATDIKQNWTHLYEYVNYNTTTMNRPDAYRKLIINLEPCFGVVYLFVRKTRQCFPNPYSCINLDAQPGTDGAIPSPKDCEWTHFMSVLDGSRDGAPTFFEIGLVSTRYYISVYATQFSRYTLQFLADIGQMPRPGKFGDLNAVQMQDLQVQLSWDKAYFIPSGFAQVKEYQVYSAMLLDQDQRTNAAVFLSSKKIMNTVCGLKHNTLRMYAKIPADQCERTPGTRCNTTIVGIDPGPRYVLNVVAVSDAGYSLAYSGLILTAEWQIVTQAASDKTIRVVGAVSGSILGILTMGFFWMLYLYK